MKITRYGNTETDLLFILYLGGSIQEMFGIASKREKEAGFIKTNEYWITQIPDEYIPKNCVPPEGGCFW